MGTFLARMWSFIRRSLTWVLVGSIGGLFMNILASAVPVTLGRAIDAVLMHYDIRLTLVVALPLPFVVILAEVAGRTVQRRTLAARTTAGAVAAHLEEAVGGIRVLRLLGSEEERARRLERLRIFTLDPHPSRFRHRPAAVVWMPADGPVMGTRRPAKPRSST